MTAVVTGLAMMEIAPPDRVDEWSSPAQLPPIKRAGAYGSPT
jgi:hypothetical protein